jgi:ribonuclease T2
MTATTFAARWRTTLAAAAGVLAALTLAAGPATAQRRYDEGYGRDSYRNYGRERDSYSNYGHDIPGQFDYFALVLSWSPTHCGEVQSRGRDDTQCNPRSGRPYSFVLHGLWPQYERRWPQDCKVANSYVPEPLLREMLDIMPARPLVIHEYKKHGTCSGLTAEEYFHLARQLFLSIKIPERFQNPAQPQTVSPQEVVEEFVRANPKLKPEDVAVACQNRPGNRLQEIHICLDRAGEPRACGQNEAPKRMCRADKMFLPPVRVRGGFGGLPHIFGR